MSHTISDETWSFAQDALEREIAGVLDDPYAWGLESDDFRAEIALMRRIAADLGLDFDAKVRENGSEYEIERLYKMIAP
jgi:hypothetical protein